MSDTSLPLISVTFITYKRLETLRPTLSSFLQNTDYPRDRLELIVCDDASPPEVQTAIRAMPFDVFAFGERQGGIGVNTNRGIKAAQGDFILQLQDDWECLGPPSYLREALAILEARPEIGMVILRPHPNPLQVIETPTIADRPVRIFVNDPARRINVVGEHAYTDWPHLKRRAFHQDIGLYAEGLRMAETELTFSRRVNAQTRHFIADMGRDAFVHIGADLSFNTGGLKEKVARALQRVPPGAALVKAWMRFKKRMNET